MVWLTALLVLLALALAPARAAAQLCPDPGPPSVAFCKNPPTVKEFSPEVYAGKWLQVYAAGTALMFSNERCVTANYTVGVGANGLTEVRVLNCEEGLTGRANCSRGVASATKGGKPGELALTFPDAPRGPNNPGTYRVVALLGNQYLGYYGAVVYSCILFGDKPQSGYFVIARAVWYRKWLLDYFKEILKCTGFEVDVGFVRTSHDSCRYFTEGFDIKRFPPMP